MKSISHIFKIIIGIIFLILSSCNSYKKLTYLQNVPITGNDSVLVNDAPEYKLQPSDKLYIKFITENEKINLIFNPLTAGASAAAVQEGALYLQSYILDDSGYIELPIIKKIKVSNCTLDEAKARIQDSALKYFNDIQVMVKLSMIKFTLLGELRSPGIKTSYDTKISILEAISYGGDVTYNGNRKKIMIIRPTINGSQTIRIDLTDKTIISTEDYFILPNDIVYVPPLKSTLFRERTKDFIFIIPTVTTIITTTILLLKSF